MARVAKLFGEKAGGAVRCPGASCPRFASAAGETWEAKVRNATRGCSRCQGLAPLPPGATESEANYDSELQRVERVWLLARVGVKVELDWLTSELLAVWQGAYESYRQSQRAYQIALLERLAGVKR